MRRTLAIFLISIIPVVASCGLESTRNPYLSYTDAYGVASQSSIEDELGGAQGLAQQVPFRRELTLAFRNNHTTADVNFKFIAWVSVASVRSADQQDALLAGGFTQLRSEYRLGTAHTLPVGTFVFDGSGPAGATTVTLGAATAASEGVPQAPTTEAFTMVTPDAIVVYWQPPVSCESVAFYYSRDGQPFTSGDEAGSGPFGGADRGGSFKTVRQVNVYQCEPLRPGVFLSQGGVRQGNEFFEAENVTFDFNPAANAQGDFAIVTFGAATGSTGGTGNTGNTGDTGGQTQTGGGT